MSGHPHVELSGKNSFEYPVSTLSDISDWETWKSAIERQMRELSTRVSKSEPKRKRSLAGRISSYATTKEDGFCGLCTCVKLIRTRKASLLQCIWLILVIAGLVIIGSKEFLRAKENLDAKFKPEKKTKTLDYAEAQEGQTYETPYIYLYFWLY